jgi:acetyl-CoA acetyltransferase
MNDGAALRGAVAIAGVGTAGLGMAPGHSELEILAQAAHAAVTDAGMTLRDVDGIATCSSSAPFWVLPVIEYLGLAPRFIDGTAIGGASFVAHIEPSIRALVAGQCNAVLVCYASRQRTSELNRSELGQIRRRIDPLRFEDPYEPLFPVSSYALAAARHMHQYGTTRRHLAEVAVAARQWACLNPEALARDPLSIDDVLNARMISDPLTQRDCCLVNDGAGAFVLVRSERAADLARKPVHVLGTATAANHRQISSMPDLTVTAAVESGQRAYAMAGVGPGDIDVAELYDAFTINTILFLEDLGFCRKGEGGEFVGGGRIAPGGAFPVNTNGGGLSCIHPGMYGVFLVIEAARQLRAEAGERQVRDAEIALVHGNGLTLSSQSTAILGTSATL